MFSSGSYKGFRISLAAFCLAVAAPAVTGQDALSGPISHNVVLRSHIGLAELAAGHGNDCWGYTSPSGREYALMGLRSAVVVVEVSDPDRPVIVGRIPHFFNTWCDIKVYKQYAYAATERHGTGLQVIDLSQVDDGIVTLVRTVHAVPDAHNLAVDTDSGFLYACLVNGGTGTTMCLDLSDPANPTPIGAGTMTSPGVHDLQVVTYDSGPYAGRQILFGNSGGFGFYIWDVTDKNSPFQLARMTYPGLSYSHQGWLSEDKQLWYMDDELDELFGRTPTTRTLVMDVSDLSAPFLASTFTTGLRSIDHNLYVKCGFIFEANYTSGLRVFDGNDDPLHPTETGWYDTYPAHDFPTFSGAWSNYSFFPSGTVVVSDINTGLYVLDVSAATIRAITSDVHTVDNGNVLAGNNGSLSATDGDVLEIAPGRTRTGNDPAVAISIVATAPCEHASQMTLRVSGSSNAPKRKRSNVRQRVLMFNWDTGEWEKIDNTVVDQDMATIVMQLEDPERFIDDHTFAVHARVEYFPASMRTQHRWSIKIDEISWTWNP